MHLDRLRSFPAAPVVVLFSLSLGLAALATGGGGRTLSAAENALGSGQLRAVALRGEDLAVQSGTLRLSAPGMHQELTLEPAGVLTLDPHELAELRLAARSGQLRAQLRSDDGRTLEAASVVELERRRPDLHLVVTLRDGFAPSSNP